jgi:hypothetical protein
MIGRRAQGAIDAAVPRALLAVAVGAAVAACASSPGSPSHAAGRLGAAESLYAGLRDLRDGINVATAAGRTESDGTPLGALAVRHDSLRARLSIRLQAIDSAALRGDDARALGIMRRTLARDLGPVAPGGSAAGASGGIASAGTGAGVYEPAWQQRWLGDSVPLADGLRGRYGGIVLDVAWALFEAQMLRDPAADPDQVWTALTRDYLRIRPHPELSWWAMRGQLVEAPGYMMNYAAGAMLIAAVRARTRALHGPFTTGDSTWYAWIAPRLYRFGLERPTREVIEEYLGGPVTPAALLEDMRRMRPVRRKRRQIIMIGGVCLASKHTRRRRCTIRAIAFRLALACVPFLTAGCHQTGNGAATPPNQPNQPTQVPGPKLVGPEPTRWSGLLGKWGIPHREGMEPDTSFSLHTPRESHGLFTFPGNRSVSSNPMARYSPPAAQPTPHASPGRAVGAPHRK